MKTEKPGLFKSADGTSYVVTFALVSSLFLLWGFCNGMIDVMDKHFQKELGLSLSQSAWVQFAHYLGYFLMALPAGWLATKLGYKGGIITGLLMVAVGGFWFIPATHIAQFWAFLLGVCFIAAGLTFLETVANPYTTVLGPQQFAATRINLAQSCNGIGWIFGPIAGGMFFYGTDASGKSTGTQTLWIPYAAVGVVVVVLAAVFYFANVPDVKTVDAYHLEDDDNSKEAVNLRNSSGPLPVYAMLLGNVAVLVVSIGMICWVALDTLGFGRSDEMLRLASRLPHPASYEVGKNSALGLLIAAAVCVVVAIAAVRLIWTTKKLSSSHSIWSHPHFSGATLTQFLYVAAQSGIFSFFINYMTAEVPPIPAAWKSGMFDKFFELNKSGVLGLNDKGASFLVSVGFFCFLAGRFSGAAILKKFAAHRVLALYALINVGLCLLVFLKLGWLSVACVFLSYFFMSVMFPTIFALGIHGLGRRAKTASSYIVMAIMGGALVPKVMGHVGDVYNMSIAFIVPLICFIGVLAYGVFWPKLSGAEALIGFKPGSGH
jgi:FHS family L-fucose permease-like MFS transporter